MKTAHPTSWIRIALLWLTLTLVIILLTIPLLAKGISRVIGNPVEPEKLDIRPIPVPVPPAALMLDEPALSATPASFLVVVVPEAISVPTPNVSAPQSDPSPAQTSISGSSATLKFSIVNLQHVIVLALTFLGLMISGRLHQTPGVQILRKENAC